MPIKRAMSKGEGMLLTYEQKLKQEHPECIAAYSYARYCGCPHSFGYEAEANAPCGMDRKNITDEVCKACWGREMPKNNGKKVWMTWKSN